MRSLVQNAASELKELSNSLVSGENLFVEVGSFLILDQNNRVHLTDPFTSYNSDEILIDDIYDAANQLMGEGDTLIGFVHTHSQSPFASQNDALASNSTLYHAAEDAGATYHGYVMNYIVGPDGGVKEYTTEALYNPDRAELGVDLEDAI